MAGIAPCYRLALWGCDYLKTHTAQTKTRGNASATMPAMQCGRETTARQGGGGVAKAGHPASRGRAVYVLIAPYPHTARRKHG